MRVRTRIFSTDALVANTFPTLGLAGNVVPVNEAFDTRANRFLGIEIRLVL